MQQELEFRYDQAMQQAIEQALDQVQQKLPFKLSTKVSQFQQPHLKYSYSGISNTSSNNEFILCTAHSFNDDFQIKLNFIESQKLFETIQLKTIELQKRMIIHKDLILYLMGVYKWNLERLEEVYYDQLAINYNSMNNLISNYHTNNLISAICQVCFRQDLLLSNYFCQHSFCNNCWTQYIRHNLAHNNILFSCMNIQCTNSPVILQFVKNIAPKLFQKYQKKICVNYSLGNKSISYCPSDNCYYFCQKLLVVQQNYVQCLCGTRYCFKCQKQPHEPASCIQVQKWQKITNQQKNNQEWIQKYTKKCPNCKQNVQKYVGCNQIKCICSFQFCFNCTNRWDQKHKINPDACVIRTSNIKITQTIEVGQKKLQQMIQKTISISHQMNKDMLSLKQTIIILTQDLGFLQQFLHSLESSIYNAWSSLKWSIISIYLRQKAQIQIQFEKDLLNQIRCIMSIVQKVRKTITYSHGYSHQTKQFQLTRESLINRKDNLTKSVQIWNQAWKNHTDA